MKPKCIILVGIASKEMTEYVLKQGIMSVLSRESIREEVGNLDYLYKFQVEAHLWDVFFHRLKQYINTGESFIIWDSTFNMEAILNMVKCFDGGAYSVEYKFFDVPLWELQKRNLRELGTKNFVSPLKMTKLYKKFKRIQR